MQESRNSIANALELRLSCTNPSIQHRKIGTTKQDAVATSAFIMDVPVPVSSNTIISWKQF